ncbi:MAG: helix-turn-helix domain-containing protein [Treponema sp.]|jgi:transcriptional regulator with XRE-family HTH domain|nr:helix-turn-helix domain-containing protein [Treponema sp.]
MLNERLKALISNLGMKDKDFAQKLGFSQPYISMILTGKKTTPSTRFFDALSRVFYVNIEWLRTGEGEMFVVPDLNLSPADASLLAKYRLLPAGERAIIDEVVDAILLKSMADREEA